MMSTKTTTEFTCDLCSEKVVMESSTKPSNWIELSFENKYEDRSFYERHICANCVRQILKVVSSK